MNGRRRLRILLFCGTVVFAILGQYYFARIRARMWDGVALYAAAVFCLLILLWQGERRETEPGHPWFGQRAWAALQSHPERGFLLLITLLLAYTAVRQHDSGAYPAALGFWASSVLVYVATFVRLPLFSDQELSSAGSLFRAAWGKLREWARRLGRKAREHRWELLFVAGCTLAGLALRLVEVGRVPYVLSGDEAAMGVSAQQVLSGELQDPFTTGWLSHPTLYFFLLAQGLRLFGSSGILGLRVLSPLAGAAALPLIYLLARRLFDRWVALVALILLTVSHFHIHFSRLGINNVYDATFALLAFLLLVRGLDAGEGDHFLPFALSGITMGLAMYFYMGTRLIPVIAATYVVLLAMRRQLSLRTEGGRLLVLLGGLLVAFGPLLLFALRDPEAYAARVHWVSMLEPGRIAAIQAATGKSGWWVWGQQFRKSVLAFNYELDPTSWYAAPIPLLDAISAAGLVLGLTVAMWKWKGRSHLFLDLWFWLAILFGGVLIENPPTSPRLVIAVPVVCLLAAVGLVSLGRMIGPSLHLREGWEMAFRILLLGGIMVLNLSFYFLRYTPRGIFGGQNTEIGTRLGQYLAQREDEAQAYFFGPNQMWFGYPTIAYLAPQVPGVDIAPETPLETIQVDRSRDAVFVFLPFRLGELPAVQERYPGGSVHAAHGHSGEVLFVTYELEFP